MIGRRRVRGGSAAPLAARYAWAGATARVCWSLVTSASHDKIRDPGTFDETLRNVAELTQRGFDTRIIFTVNRADAGDALHLLDIADRLGASLVKYHVFSTIGTGHGAEDLAMQPLAWIEFYEELERVAPSHRTRTWYQPTYARRSRMAHYAAQGYCGCIGRTLDRISIFPDGRCYVCSYLFDTDLHFATMTDGDVVLTAVPTSSTCSPRRPPDPVAATAKSRPAAAAAARPKSS
jgi:hypothetical protein